MVIFNSYVKLPVGICVDVQKKNHTELQLGFPTCRAPGWLVCTSTPTQIGPGRSTVAMVMVAMGPVIYVYMYIYIYGWDINILKLFSWRKCDAHVPLTVPAPIFCWT